MSKPIISVKDLSKSYLVGHQSDSQERYTALRDVIGRHVKNLARNALDMIRGHQILQGDDKEEFWALKEINFEINKGEVVGVIGRNGAGKSTLLKILSRITEPTEGRVTLRGRVASLLEVGTGFHPELTGRENIFLNGAILGMTRSEIKSKFNEIVEFAGVEKFLDTPVKRYSSGMYVRLAFSVAAHLDPEILIVDEVLAVGDMDFQKKCLGKMKDVASHGRTVLFVSHNLGAIRQMCTRCIVLKNGNMLMDAESNHAISAYETPDRIEKSSVESRFQGPLRHTLRIFSVLVAVGGATSIDYSSSFAPTDSLEIRVKGESYDTRAVRIVIAIFSQGVRLLSAFDSEKATTIGKGGFESVFTLPSRFLRPGYYTVGVGAYDGTTFGDYTWAESAADFTVREEWEVGFEERALGMINGSVVRGVRIQAEENVS